MKEEQNFFEGYLANLKKTSAVSSAHCIKHLFIHCIMCAFHVRLKQYAKT